MRKVSKKGSKNKHATNEKEMSESVHISGHKRAKQDYMEQQHSK